MGYHVRLVDEDGEESVFTSCDDNITLSNLTLYHTYCVTVAAFGRKGSGPESKKKCAMMDNGGINIVPRSPTAKYQTERDLGSRLKNHYNKIYYSIKQFYVHKKYAGNDNSEHKHFLSNIFCFLLTDKYQYKPLHNDHLGDRGKWPLGR